MKKNLLLIAFLMFIGLPVSQAQDTELPQDLYDFHLKKSKSNKLAAWITLGSGVAMIVSGYAINLDQPYFGPDASSDDNNKGLWLSYVGGATTLTSIPLFISGGKHKKKAQIQLDKGAIGLVSPIKYTGIGLVVSF